jgi:hypothetical protein
MQLQLARFRRDPRTLNGKRFIQVALSYANAEDSGGDM